MSDAVNLSRWRRWRRTLALLIAGYLGILLVLLALERKFIFLPTPAARDWRPPPDPNIVDVEIPTRSGAVIHAWWLPRPGAGRTILYSHGNAGNVSHRGASLVRWSQAMDASVLVYDYPGYGRSTGVPDEASCYAAVDAAWDWLVSRQAVAPERILAVGASLGGAMAARLGAERDCQAVVLIKAFSSIPDMASHRFPWLPVRYFVRTQFDAAAMLARCHRPVFIVHGVDDRTVPYICAERLFQSAAGPKELFKLDANDHHDALPPEFFPRLKAFLDSHFDRRTPPP